MIVHVERARSRGLVEPEAIDQLDQLRPHLARASLLSARMQLQGAATATAVLEWMGRAAAVLDRTGRIMAANRLIDDLVPSVVQGRKVRIGLADKRADGLLETAIAWLNKLGAASGIVLSIPVPAPEGARPVVIHVIPISGAAHDVFSLANAIVLCTPISISDAPVAVVRGLFDLTPAEARLASLIATGLSPRQAAQKLGISEETARTTLKRVFGKVGVSRQSQLAALLSRLVLR